MSSKKKTQMNNAALFKAVFNGTAATTVWSMSFEEFLKWLDEIEPIENAQALLFSKWARKNDEHVCASCTRNIDNNPKHQCECPIQRHFALPLDGYCHLWRG